jgi:hypothetical protein
MNLNNSERAIIILWLMTVLALAALCVYQDRVIRYQRQVIRQSLVRP